MQEQDRLNRNRQRLSDCYPEFAAKVSAVIRDVEGKISEKTGRRFRIRIQEAYRTPEQQLEKFKKRVSKVKYSYHNCTGYENGRAVPEALAVDIVDDDNPLDVDHDLALIVAASARAHGLQTGILWGLTAKDQATVNRAITLRRWTMPGEWKGEIGWDALHIEPANFSISRAKAGERPF